MGDKTVNPDKERTTDRQRNSECLCFIPSDRTHDFHRYAVNGHDLVSAEISAALSGTRMGMGEFISRIADIRQTINAASKGILSPHPDTAKPVVTQPDLWELRWTYPGNVQYRMYFAQNPTGLPELVATHFHRKDISGTAEQQRLRQNEAMALGQRRFDSGRAAWWGHRRTHCRHCDWSRVI